ncbi:MAG: rRNA maturation RNase YbeY [Gammaproteobacteria bacterium]|nr:rRNA maturation RNase YbeY [Gammaproteobacteria bacterium]
MKVIIELINASSETMLPSTQDFQHWSEATLLALAAKNNEAAQEEAELCIRLVDEEESASLNENFRQKKGPTNILSFPYTEVEGITEVEGVKGSDLNLLGDLAICVPLVKKEATEQNKPIEAHWAHLTVHGVLHLHGYDHEEDNAANKMETMEISILNTLGYENPYELDVKGNE